MLRAALRWCRHKNIPIINVSAGSIETKDFKNIQRAIDALTKKGQLVVAAYNKNGLPTMPAGHKAVIGVRTDPRLKDYEYKIDNKTSKRDYYASSQHKLHFIVGKELITSGSTSFAAPTITALLVNSGNKNTRLE